jgi:hypothetical protein
LKIRQKSGIRHFDDFETAFLWKTEKEEPAEGDNSVQGAENGQK